MCGLCRCRRLLARSPASLLPGAASSASRSSNPRDPRDKVATEGRRTVSKAQFSEQDSDISHYMLHVRSKGTLYRVRSTFSNFCSEFSAFNASGLRVRVLGKVLRQQLRRGCGASAARGGQPRRGPGGEPLRAPRGRAARSPGRAAGGQLEPWLPSRERGTRP